MGQSGKTEDWKDFELLIARIEAALVPSAHVRHNHRLEGKSGRRRQIDVSITAKIGPHNILVVLECKKQKRPVSINQVEAFASKLDDVGASQGAMVSTSGFDAGAVAQAERHAIRLFTYQEATTFDWDRLISGDSWFYVYGRRPMNLRCQVRFSADDIAEEVSPLTELLQGDQEKTSTLQEAFDDMWKRVQCQSDVASAIIPGPCRLEVGLEPDAVTIAERPVFEVHFQFDVVYVEYPIGLALGGGHVFSSLGIAVPHYTELWTEPIDIAELFSSRAGRVISEAEYNEMVQKPNFKPLPRPLMSGERFLRLDFVQTSELDKE